MANIEIKGVSKIYNGNARALDNVNLIIKDGEFTAITGDSNIGNFALFHLFYDNDINGELYIDGELMNDVSPSDRKIAGVIGEEISNAYIPDKKNMYTLYPKKTVYENLALPLKSKNYPNYEIERRINEILPLMSIEHFRNHEIESITAFARLRVSISRAIILSPKVFLYYEPFSASIDTKYNLMVREEIKVIHQQMGSTIIYITKDQDEAFSMTNNVYTLNNGRIQQNNLPSNFKSYPSNESKEMEAKLSSETPMRKPSSYTTEKGKSEIPFYAYKGNSPYIFVSYAHADSNRVFPIITDFYNEGFNLWYDEGIDPGNEWPKEISNALNKCSLFIVFISSSAVKSKNVRNEINLAINKDKPFLAIYLEETDLIDGLDLQMSSIQAIMHYRMNENDFYYKCNNAFNSFGIKKDQN